METPRCGRGRVTWGRRVPPPRAAAGHHAGLLRRGGAASLRSCLTGALSPLPQRYSFSREWVKEEHRSLCFGKRGVMPYPEGTPPKGRGVENAENAPIMHCFSTFCVGRHSFSIFSVTGNRTRPIGCNLSVCLQHKRIPLTQHK